jgi:large subunit ribosomal protein L17
MKLGPRKGDGAEVVIIELVTEAVVPKTKAARKVTKVEETAPAADVVTEAAEEVVAEAAAEAEAE